MSRNIIEVQNLHKHFSGKKVLDGISLTVKEGQTLALLGRNGEGKTTTIKTLMGLVTPDAGTISVLGLDPRMDPIAVRASVGYLAEDQTMFGWMSVAQLIRFVSSFYPTWNRELAEQYLKQFALPLRTKVKHLSKGQNVRLGLLIALAHEPRLVVLDDPALGLDPIMRREFNRDLVSHLQSNGRTVLYSSHLLDEVEAVADHIAILNGGRLIREGSTESLRSQVKRLVMPAVAASKIMSRLEILDGRMVAGEILLTVDHAEDAQRIMQREEIEHQMIDLNLDEIFEAFVAGHREIRFELPEREALTPA